MERTEAGAARGESRLCLVAAAEEQAWNERHLSRPVRAPLIAAWSYRAPAVVLGCSQRPDAAMSAAARAARVALVERRSGGGAVLARRGRQAGKSSVNMKIMGSALLEAFKFWTYRRSRRYSPAE